MKPINREHWLELAKAPLAKMLRRAAGLKLPKCRVSCGFTGSRVGMRAIGIAWNKRAAADGVAQVYISPLLDEGSRVLDVLLHEFIHVCIPEAGHRRPFHKAAISVGLKGKMTATVASKSLLAQLKPIMRALGPYPHARLRATSSRNVPRKGKPVVIIDPTTGAKIEAGANQLLKLVDPAMASYALWMEARFLANDPEHIKLRGGFKRADFFPKSPLGNKMQLAPKK